jgi:hypothetical protein
MDKVLLTSSERVHKWRLRHSLGRENLLGFGHFRVRFRELQTNRLGQVGVEPHPLLQQQRGNTVSCGGGGVVVMWCVCGERARNDFSLFHVEV